MSSFSLSQSNCRSIRTRQILLLCTQLLGSCPLILWVEGNKIFENCQPASLPLKKQCRKGPPSHSLGKGHRPFLADTAREGCGDVTATISLPHIEEIAARNLTEIRSAWRATGSTRPLFVQSLAAQNCSNTFARLWLGSISNHKY